MKQREKDVLRANRMYIMEKIDELRLRTTLNVLYSQRVLDEDDKEVILNETTTSNKVAQLLDLLRFKEARAFDAFVQALHYSGCALVARHIQSQMQSQSAGESVDEHHEMKAVSPGLPNRMPKLIGRGEDCKIIVQKLTSGELNTDSSCIVTMIGPPGSGKTTLAIHIGHMMKEQGKDVVYISLRTVSSITTAATNMLQIIGIPVGNDPVSQLQGYLVSLQSQTVLILDNAEDLQNGDDVSFNRFLEGISKEATNLVTLVTSRNLLSKLDYHVPPDNVPLSPLTQEQSFLFFKNEEGISDALARRFSQHKICGGIPLLLKIIASLLQQSGTVDPDELYTNLQDCKDEFLAGPHPSMQHLFNHLEVFYNHLPPEVKKALAYLAVFPTVFTKQKAKEVLFKEMGTTNFDTILSLLESLSLVQRDEVDNCAQYSLHPLVQAFCIASRWGVCGDYNMAIRLFSQHYLDLLKQLSDDFISTDCKPTIEKYQINKMNICHALSVTTEDDFLHLKHFGLHISTETVNFLAKVMSMDEFMSVYGKFLSVAKNLTDKTLYSECLVSIGFKQLCFYGYKSAYLTETITNLQEAHDLQTSLGIHNDECCGHCKCKLGLCTFAAGDKQKGISLIAQGIGVRKRLACTERAGKIERMLVAGAFSDLAMAMYDSDKYRAAINIWENHCLVRYRKLLGTHPFTASVLDYMGNAYQKLNLPEEAVECKKESLAMRCSLLGEDHLDTARAYYGLGCALGVLGATEEARRNLNKALRVQERFHASEQDTRKTKRELDRLQGDQIPHHVQIEEL